MKGMVVEYLERCLECQTINVEHQHPARLLNSLPITEWKREIISLDIVMGLQKTQRQHDSITVLIEKLSKETQFMPVKSTSKVVHIF